MATLQLPEGYTVRKVGNSLKVVPMRRKKVVAAVKEKAMPKQIEVSIHPFGSYREQLWIGKVVNGEFQKEQPLYKVIQTGKIVGRKTYDGKYGKPSTSENWEISVPDNFPLAIAKSRLSDASFNKRENEYEVIYG